jgi:crotonobetainyl-CoA:carnitine CoA-transferase CaiB-like acyl-CoA transferase
MAPDPIRVDGGRLPVRLPPPRLGEHTESVLAELDQTAV